MREAIRSALVQDCPGGHGGTGPIGCGGTSQPRAECLTLCSMLCEPPRGETQAWSSLHRTQSHSSWVQQAGQAQGWQRASARYVCDNNVYKTQPREQPPEEISSAYSQPQLCEEGKGLQLRPASIPQAAWGLVLPLLPVHNIQTQQTFKNHRGGGAAERQRDAFMPLCSFWQGCGAGFCWELYQCLQQRRVQHMTLCSTWHWPVLLFIWAFE